MCIAVIKPKNVEMPSQKTLKNCFDSNPHGAGFMYSDGSRLVIQKGYMNFADFYKALTDADLKKEQLVFLHFRIATHGLRDGGNTHPFPVTTDVNEMRSVKNKFDGYGLIHNGIMHFDPKTFKAYDPTGVISDTMLFSMILSECIDNMNKAPDKMAALFEDFDEPANVVAYSMITGDNTYDSHIENYLGWNKIAVMDADENFVYYGDWIHNKGMLYSNTDYEDYVPYNYGYSHGGYYSCGGYSDAETTCLSTYKDCCSCGTYDRKANMISTIYGYCCEKCKKDFGLIECKECKDFATPDDIIDGICRECKANDYRCEECNEKASYLRSKEGKLYCQSCYEKLFSVNDTSLALVNK